MYRAFVLRIMPSYEDVYTLYMIYILTAPIMSVFTISYLTYTYTHVNISCAWHGPMEDSRQPDLSSGWNI